MRTWDELRRPRSSRARRASGEMQTQNLSARPTRGVRAGLRQWMPSMMITPPGWRRDVGVQVASGVGVEVTMSYSGTRTYTGERQKRGKNAR